MLDRTRIQYRDGICYVVPHFSIDDFVCGEHIGEHTALYLMWEGERVAMVVRWDGGKDHKWCLYDTETGALLYHASFFHRLRDYVSRRWFKPAFKLEYKWKGN